MNSLLSRVTIDPEICHGKPVIRGLRYPVESILEYLAAGDSMEEVLAEFPDLERDDLLACMEFAKRSLQLRSPTSGPGMKFLVDAHLPPGLALCCWRRDMMPSTPAKEPPNNFVCSKSGVALRFPPQSKTLARRRMGCGHPKASNTTGWLAMGYKNRAI